MMAPVRTAAISVAYGMLERATRGRGITRQINGDRVSFPARWSRYYPSDYQAATHRFLESHCAPGTTALDIGAHIGLFSVVMARAVGSTGKVISFEPTPLTRGVLEKTIEVNRCGGWVEVRAEAVTRKPGRAKLYCSSTPGSNANSLVAGDTPGVVLDIDAVSIDTFMADGHLPLTCIKVDVEGAEVDVLAGALATVADSRPAIAVDVHPTAIVESGHAVSDVWDVLADMDMTVRSGGEMVDRDWVGGQKELFDLHALPRDMPPSRI